MNALALPLVIFLAMASYSSAAYCVCNTGVSDTAMQSNIDYACSAGADCDNHARATIGDTSLTRPYIPKVFQTPDISPSIAHFYEPIENRCIYEGRVVDQLYYTSDHIDRCFSNIRLNCLYEINETIVLRFVLDFYSQVTLQRDDSGVILIFFMIQNEFITLSLQQFGQILRIQFDGQAVFTNEWYLAHLPYGMFLTRLFRHVMEFYPHLDNGIYDVIERVMRPLALRQPRRPRSDRYKAHRSISSSSFHHQGTSSHQHDDDDYVKTSRASTPYPTTYLNSLNPIDYQNDQMPSSSEQTNETLFARQTTFLNQTQRMHGEMHGGFKSFEKALKRVFSKKKK
nr:plasmodesmata callose binding protein 3-like [Tanacetum cinerariifolium]